MKLYIGSPRQLPFVFFTLSWLLIMELIHQFYLIEESSSNYITIAILTLTIYNYLATCFKQPGIIPNSNLTEEQAMASIQDIVKFEGMDTEEQEDQIIAETSRTSRRTLGAPVTERAMANEGNERKDVNYKYCESCRQIKPPSAEHCGSCYGCVRKHYKHSAIVANCVGERNSRNYFWAVLGMNLLGAVYVYKGTIEVLKDWRQYVEISKQFEGSSEIKPLILVLAVAFTFRTIIARRFIKIRWFLNIIILSLVVFATIHFRITPVFSLKTGLVWVFLSLSYTTYPLTLKALWNITFLGLTGKSRKQLQSGGLKPGEKNPKRMALNLYEFLFGDIPLQ